MADLSVNLAGIKAPNPFWVASGPPTNSAYQAHRAFEAGWGGFVWKTLGDPIVNVAPRLAAQYQRGRRIAGMNNIELATDRPLDENIREIQEVKKRWPDRAIVVSLMVEPKREAWHEIIKQMNDTGCDGVELNFGCPHGMSERGMGAAVGQVPDYTRQITEWAREVATVPVVVKLTPNVANIRYPAMAAKEGGANAVALINSVHSLAGVNLDTLTPCPSVRDLSTTSGYGGPAVKPIALAAVSSLASWDEFGLPISGIGGIETWSDAAEFISLGATSIQVCIGTMKYGFRLVRDMISGLSNWMDAKGFRTIEDFRGVAAAKLRNWGGLDLAYRLVAHIDETRCIGCQVCYIACEDTAHQAIRLDRDGGGSRIPIIDEGMCVGCNLCALVCPVEQCISLQQRESGKPVRSYNEYLAAGERPQAAYPLH